MWNTPGVTVKRIYTFQSPSVNLGASQQRVPFVPITNIGMIRALRLWVPYQAGTNTTGTTALTTPTALQMPQLKLISRLQVQMAGLTSTYDVTGQDLGYLAYVGNGMSLVNRRKNAQKLGYVDTAANYPAQFSFPTSLSPVGMTNKRNIPIVEYNHTGPVFNLGTSVDIPITENYVIPGAAALDQQGNIVPGMGDVEIESGLMVMQSSAQSVSLAVLMSALEATDYTGVLINSATPSTDDKLTATVNVNLEHEYYDLPGQPADMPNSLITGFAVTRVARDIQVANGQVDYYFLRAGLLLRVLMVAYADGTTYNTVVDLGADGTATPDKISVVLQDGQSTEYISETASGNFARCERFYGDASPGILVHDLLALGEGRLTQCIATPQTTALRESLRGLPTSVTRLHVVEERLIPVQVTVAA